MSAKLIINDITDFVTLPGRFQLKIDLVAAWKAMNVLVDVHELDVRVLEIRVAGSWIYLRNVAVEVNGVRVISKYFP